MTKYEETGIPVNCTEGITWQDDLSPEETDSLHYACILATRVAKALDDQGLDGDACMKDVFKGVEQSGELITEYSDINELSKKIIELYKKYYLN